MQSNLPFSIFRNDLKQYSLGELDEDGRTFLWHQFMLDVLLSIPRSSTDNEHVITVCKRIEETIVDNSFKMKQADIDEFRITYKPDTAINWYTRASFLFKALNKACRTLNSDFIVPFHSIIKDLNIQLKQLHIQQKKNGTLRFPMIVYRGQADWGIGEVEKIRESIGGLISMNTFLSTTIDLEVAEIFGSGLDKNTSIIFKITINNVENDKQLQTFADITQDSNFVDEKEILFTMSSVFKVNSITEHNKYWMVNLELTNCKQDKNILKLVNDTKTYLYQISNKQLPFIVFKQLFTTNAHGYYRPFTELMKFVLTDITQLFVINAYKKQCQMKELIDNEPTLHTLIIESNNNIMLSQDTTICLLFDLLNSFFYFKDKNEQDQINFNLNDTASLICFGGFLLLCDEYNKSIQYFKMLLENESIDNKLKVIIYALLRVIYTILEERNSALKSFPKALQPLQSFVETFVSSQLGISISTPNTTLYDPDEQTNQTNSMIEPFISLNQSDDEVNEKLRLVILGHNCSEQQNFVNALNHWEEALEITSYIPSSLGTVFNGVIYMQMAAAYSRLNNTFEALNTMEKGFTYMEPYYPSSHRMFGVFNLMYGYYLIQNERSSESIERLNKAVKNPSFSNNKDFLGYVYSLLVMAAMQSGDIESAEQYGYKAVEYQSPTNISSLIPSLLEVLPQIKLTVNSLGTEYARQIIGASMQISQQWLSNIAPNSNILPNIIDEQTCTYDTLINYADHYRHHHDYKHAEIYYNKALIKTTEIDSRIVWNIYKKMARMKTNDNESYRSYFIEQYSKYDENNPKHFEMIITLQIIMYKMSLSQNEIELAFDCLIYGTFMAIKFLYYQIDVESNFITDLFNHIFHHKQIAKISSILTQLLQIYSTECTLYIQRFISTYFVHDSLYINLAKSVHHPQIDKTYNRIKSKYNNNQSSNSIFLFLDILLQIFRQSITKPKKTTLTCFTHMMEFFEKFNDKTSSLFYLMKTLECLLIDDTQNFLFNLDKFRRNTINFEYYKKLKEKISFIFQILEEDQLRAWLEIIANNL